jgi:ubiquitin carboxyl-terminal hydrolase L5
VQTDWVDAAAPAIQQRMAKYASSEVRFNLMAIIHDKRQTLSKQVGSHR